MLTLNSLKNKSFSRPDQALEKLTKRLFKALTVTFALIPALYIVLAYFNVAYSSLILDILLVSSSLLSAFSCYVSIHNSTFRKPCVIILLIAISLVNTNPGLVLDVIVFLPTVIAIYFFDRKFLVQITIVNIIGKIISTIVKTDWKQNVNIYANRESTIIRLLAIVFMITVELAAIMSVFIPIIRYLLQLKSSQEKTIREQKVAASELLDFCSTVTGYHSKYLSVHIDGVREITKVILNSLIQQGEPISNEYYNQIVFSVQFHDIGKIYIDSSILDKSGKLTTEEFSLIKEHPQKGKDLFSRLPKNILNEEWKQVCSNVILQHHERLDGSGYPYGIGEVSFEAQVVAVADVVDALLSWRPYKRPFSWKQMIDCLCQDAEKINKKCVDAVLKNELEIIGISDTNNERLRKIFELSQHDVLRD